LNKRIAWFFIAVILLILPGIITAQGFSSLLNLQTGFGTPISAFSARSLALGSTGIASVTTPDALVVNPALMVWGEGQAEVMVSARINRQQESRSYPVYDSFNAVLVYNEYVMNDHLFSHADGGMRFTIPQNAVPALSVGIGTYGYYSHDYKYKEEVRDRYTSGGVTDRVLGWNKMDMTGEVRTIVLGVAVEPVANVAVGMNFGGIIDKLGSTWSVDYANVDSTDHYVHDDVETDGLEWMMTFGSAYKLSPRVTVGLRAMIPVGEWDMTLNREVAGLGTTNADSSVTYKYPLSLGWGVQYRPQNIHRPSLMLDLNWTKWSSAEVNGQDSNYDDVLEIRAGVEHRVFENIPVRLGCAFIPSYLDRELTMTMISLGTGFHAGHFQLDLATDFGRRQYRLNDAFPEHFYGGQDRTDQDRVEEWLMEGILTVIYTF
jgi:hypothetical protein